MRIWAFPSFYPYNYNGLKSAGIFSHRQYKALISIGIEVNVIQPIPGYPIYPFSLLHPQWKQYSNYAYPKQRIYDGVKVFHPRIINFRPNRFLRKSYSERYADSIVNFFKVNKISLDPQNDIFYSRWIPDAYMVQNAAKILGIRSAIMVIGDDVLVWPHESNIKLEIFKNAITNADLLLTVAKYLGDEANRMLGTNLNFHVVHEGVNYDFFKPNIKEQKSAKNEFKIPQNKIAILDIGTLIKRKGWLDMFRALQLVKKSNDNFVIIAVYIGSPEFNIEEEISKHGLENNFLNLGEVSPDKINILYNAIDIFCLPSHSEGIANSVVEAMSSGLPVITTDICGHPELVIDGVNGILVPMMQPEILAEKILLLINDKKLRMQLGTAARNFIVKEWGSFADNAKALYEIIMHHN